LAPTTAPKLCIQLLPQCLPAGRLRPLTLRTRSARGVSRHGVGAGLDRDGRGLCGTVHNVTIRASLLDLSILALLPLAFGTPAASAHADPLQHHLDPLFEGWGQLCVSPLQGPALRTEKPKWGESPLPQALQSPRPMSPGLPCQVWHPVFPPPPQPVVVSLNRLCFPECNEAGFCGQGQGCWCPAAP